MMNHFTTKNRMNPGFTLSDSYKRGFYGYKSFPGRIPRWHSHRTWIPRCFFLFRYFCKTAGLTPLQGFVTSFLENASAGEYIAFTLIGAGATYIELCLMTIIANARYLLMSCAMSQRFSPDTPMIHRFFVAFDLTDELFGIAIGRPGYLNPYYSYGAFLVALPGWSIGTAAGVIAGNLLPGDMVKALSVSLFGMFLAIIIPPARKDKVVLVLIIISFAASYLCSRLPVIRDISSGTRTIILTLIIAGIAAWRFPPQTEITPENADAQKEQGADV